MAFAERLVSGREGRLPLIETASATAVGVAAVGREALRAEEDVFSAAPTAPTAAGTGRPEMFTGAAVGRMVAGSVRLVGMVGRGMVLLPSSASCPVAMTSFPCGTTGTSVASVGRSREEGRVGMAAAASSSGATAGRVGLGVGRAASSASSSVSSAFSVLASKGAEEGATVGISIAGTAGMPGIASATSSGDGMASSTGARGSTGAAVGRSATGISGSSGVRMASSGTDGSI